MNLFESEKPEYLEKDLSEPAKKIANEVYEGLYKIPGVDKVGW